MRIHRYLLAAAALLAGGLAFAADKPPAKQAYQVVYLDESRPVLIRLNIEIDGKPLQVVWEEFLDGLFKDADADKNGYLDKDEAAKVPTPQSIFGNNRGFILAEPTAAGRPGSAMLTAMDSNRDGKVTRDELGAYFRQAGALAFQLQSGGVDRLAQRRLIASGRGQVPSADTLNDAIFKLLDTDKDGKLSREELLAAPKLLDRLDADDDEVLTTAEIIQQPPPSGYEQFVVFDDGMQQQPNSPFIAVRPGEPASNLARQILQRYAKGDKAKAKKVARADLSLDEKAFAALDADEDGELDAEELARFASRPPDIELMVRLGKTRKAAAIEVISPAPKEPIGPHDPVNVEIGNTRLNLRITLPGPERPGDALKQQYRQQFMMADTDGNGYLDEKEAMASGFFRGSYKSMDTDGDGKLFLKEMLAFLDRQESVRNKAMASCVTLNVSDQGKGILDLMDTSKDGRLGLRELRQVVNLLKDLDRDGDGMIARNEIPRSYTLSAAQGGSVANPGFSGVVAVRAGGPGDPERPPPPTTGPLWFRKMDRNRDGDVSRREFLGTDEEFRKVDTDGDGLISLAEAEAFDAEFRKTATKR